MTEVVRATSGMRPSCKSHRLLLGFSGGMFTLGVLRVILAPTQQLPPRLLAGERVGGRYIIQSPIGDGRAGVVFKAVNDTGHTFALKLATNDLIYTSGTVGLKHDASDADKAESLERELQFEQRILEKINNQCPYVVRLVEAMKLVNNNNKTTTVLVFDYYASGSMHTYLIERGPYARARILTNSLEQVTIGLQCLIDIGVRHEDIWPKNILVHNDNFYITDFGSASESRPGTPYGTPEINQRLQAVFEVGKKFCDTPEELKPWLEYVQSTISPFCLVNESADACNLLRVSTMVDLVKYPTSMPEEGDGYSQFLSKCQTDYLEHPNATHLRVVDTKITEVWDTMKSSQRIPRCRNPGIRGVWPWHAVGSYFP